MKKIIIGVMGPGSGATTLDMENAYQLGQLIAQQGWALLTGGRQEGVMNAASQGAKAANGLTIGILPDAHTIGMSEAIDIPIITDLGYARNQINVLSSDVVIACGMGPGTASEIALAIKYHKKIVLLNSQFDSQIFFHNLAPDLVAIADTVPRTIELVNKFLASALIQSDTEKL